MEFDKEIKQKAKNRIESFIDSKIDQLKEQDLPLYETVALKENHNGNKEKEQEAIREQNIIKEEIAKLEAIYNNL